MRDSRGKTDPRSPVQPDRVSLAPFVVLAILAVPVAWTVRDSLFDNLSVQRASTEGEKAQADPRGDLSTDAKASAGNLASLFSAEDYPQDALRREETGTTTVELRVGTNGRVTNCAIASSSGSQSLDATTCKILTERARFTPARDSTGRPVASDYVQRVTWRLE